jgi:hypothetical protein
MHARGNAAPPPPGTIFPERNERSAVFSLCMRLSVRDLLDGGRGHGDVPPVQVGCRHRPFTCEERCGIHLEDRAAGADMRTHTMRLDYRSRSKRPQVRASVSYLPRLSEPLTIPRFEPCIRQDSLCVSRSLDLPHYTTSGRP